MSARPFPLPPELDLVAWLKYPEHWDKVEHWAQCNSVIWRRVSIMANHHGLTEVERLQLLAYALLKSQVEGMNDAYEKALRQPIFITLPKDAQVQPDGSLRFGVSPAAQAEAQARPCVFSPEYEESCRRAKEELTPEGRKVYEDCTDPDAIIDNRDCPDGSECKGPGRGIGDE